MNLRLISVTLSAILVAVSSSDAFAQSRGGGNTGGGNTGGANTGNFTQFDTGNGFNLGTATSNATGSTGFGTTSTGSSTNTSGTGTTGSTTAGTGARTPSQPAQSFVGGNASQNFVGGARQSTNQRQNNRQMQQFQNQQQGKTQTQTTGTPRAIRTSVAIGFNFPTASASQLSGKLASANSLSLGRFTSTKPEFANVNVSLNSNGVAVLTGSSPTKDASRLAANLVRIQPGVRKVDNQLTVAAE